MNLLIILQSHSVSDSQKQLGIIDQDHLRYPGVDKAEISRRCIWSLVDSVNYLVKVRPDVTCQLVVIDDHSDADHLTHLTHIMSLCQATNSVLHLDETGILASLKACYLYGKDHGSDLVYFAQDDYLYEPSCLAEMLDIHHTYTEKKLGKSVCVYPYNDPYRYQDHNIVPVRIVQGKNRHWRTSYQTACCFMVQHDVIVSEWDLFEDFYNHPVDPRMEDDTINLLFQQREHILFTPIPSLALHMQYESERDPYVDWRKLWDQYQNTAMKLPETVVLNVGSGNTKLNFSSLSQYTEVTMDADPSVNPDFIGDITDLSQIPSGSVDIFWASHILEHIYTHKVPDTLHGIYRIIKDNGMAVIMVPNLKYLAEHIQSGQVHVPLYDSPGGPITALDMLYGSIIKVQQGHAFMSHKTGFTAEYASALLEHLKIPGFIQEAGSNLFILISKTALADTCVNINDILTDFYES